MSISEKPMSIDDLLTNVLMSARTFIKGVIFIVASFWIGVASAAALLCLWFAVIFIQWYSIQLLRRKILYHERDCRDCDAHDDHERDSRGQGI